MHYVHVFDRRPVLNRFLLGSCGDVDIQLPVPRQRLRKICIHNLLNYLGRIQVKLTPFKCLPVVLYSHVHGQILLGLEVLTFDAFQCCPHLCVRLQMLEEKVELRLPFDLNPPDVSCHWCFEVICRIFKQHCVVVVVVFLFWFGSRRKISANEAHVESFQHPAQAFRFEEFRKRYELRLPEVLSWLEPSWMISNVRQHDRVAASPVGADDAVPNPQKTVGEAPLSHRDDEFVGRAAGRDGCMIWTHVCSTSTFLCCF
mmetsp:Transcript_19613/g.34971  ORF Transcript_19613/g.34971 Transcript_19613/m.34971 type:complete len:257 (+) Transcript_19613:585-1355(+)